MVRRSKKTLMKTSCRTPGFVRLLALTKPGHRRSRFQGSHFPIQGLHNNPLARQSIRLTDFNILARPHSHTQSTVATTSPGVYASSHNNLGRILVRIRELIPLQVLNPALPQQNLESIIEAIAARDPEMAVLYVDRQAKEFREVLGNYLRTLSVTFHEDQTA